MYITNDNNLYVAGYNDNDELGKNDPADNKFELVENLKNKVKQVSSLENYTLVLTTDGKLYTTGKNDKGQLGMGNNHKIVDFSYVSGNSIQNTIATNRLSYNVELPKKKTYTFKTYMNMTPSNNFNNLLLRPVSGTLELSGHVLDIYAINEEFIKVDG